VFLRFEKSFLFLEILAKTPKTHHMINAAINPNIPAQSSPGTTAFSVCHQGENDKYVTDVQRNNIHARRNIAHGM